MTLDDYLHRERMGVRDFAEIAGLSVSVLYNHLNGQPIGSIRLIRVIYEATGGEVDLRESWGLP